MPYPTSTPTTTEIVSFQDGQPNTTASVKAGIAAQIQAVMSFINTTNCGTAANPITTVHAINVGTSIAPLTMVHTSGVGSTSGTNVYGDGDYALQVTHAGGTLHLATNSTQFSIDEAITMSGNLAVTSSSSITCSGGQLNIGGINARVKYCNAGGDSAYTVEDFVTMIEVDTNGVGGVCAITLPDAGVVYSRLLTVYVKDATANTTVTCAGADTYFGAGLGGETVATMNTAQEFIVLQSLPNTGGWLVVTHNSAAFS